MASHPMQQVVKDQDGVLRFRRNAIVRYLLDAGPFDLNVLERLDFTDEDREQFVQLIGYSLSGFGDLDCATSETEQAAWAVAEQGMSPEAARIQALEDTLGKVRTAFREALPHLFGVGDDVLGR